MKQRMRQIGHIGWMTAVTVLIAMVCVAGWDADLFDGESKQFGYGYDRALQTYTAVVERATVIGYNETLTARRWGSRWTLAEAKEDIKGQLLLYEEWWSDDVGFADPSELDANGTFDAWFESGTNWFPDLNTSNILVNVGAATNWFDETPYFGTVVHSNGWRFADDVLNEMVVAGFEGYNTDLVYAYAYISEEYRGSHNYEDTETWADAKSVAAADFTLYDYSSQTNMAGGNLPMPNALTYSQVTDYNTSTNYYAYAECKRVKYFLTNAAPYAVEVGIYWHAEPDVVWNTQEVFFEPYTTGITTNHSVVVQATMQSGDTLETDWIGESWSTGEDIVWCRAATLDDPSQIYPSFSHTYIEGYETEYFYPGYQWHYRFDVTNGFEYVEE